MNRISFYRQPSFSTCGPTCLRMILEYYGTYMQEWDIMKSCPLQKNGWTSEQLATAAFNCGLKTEAFTLNNEELNNQELPLIVQSSSHYVVLYKIKGKRIYIADPAKGKIKYKLEDFLKQKAVDEIITAFHFIKLPSFKKTGKPTSNLSLIKNFLIYMIPYKSVICKALSIALIISILQTILPFLTRSIIDVGLENSSWDFIQLLLIGNIILVISNILGTFAHTYLITHITNRVKYCMLDDYMRKILSVKYSFFISIKIGDLLQRVTDNERIQPFISGPCVSSLFSLLYLIIFTAILFYFDYRLFLIYLFFSGIYVGWNILFLKQRKNLDYNFWDIKSTNNKLILQVFSNIIDIKCFVASKHYIEKWRKNIFDLFRQNMSFFYYSQTQDVGAKFIMQAKNLLLTFVSCKLVYDGKMTLGTLFAVQYIVGYLDTPLYQITDFLNQFQLIMISLNRINAFNTQPDDYNINDITFIPKSRDLLIKDVSFRYPDTSICLNRINILLLSGKKYGIIGQSGCGKSTLLKVICGVLEPEIGNMWLGTTNTQSLSLEQYRSLFSIDLQESRLFEGSILENIVYDLSDYDEDRLIKCVEIASIRREIENLPNSYNTLIAGDNRKLSRGQEQRILIARTIYRQTDIYIFDEIASCLNSEMEENIVDKIDAFLSDKTKIYVTHRPECLHNSDLVYFMNNGAIADIGNYEELTKRKRL